MTGSAQTTLEAAREKLFPCLCGSLGGPQDDVQRFGHPRLHARHRPFAIGVRERDPWLACTVRRCATARAASAPRAGSTPAHRRDGLPQRRSDRTKHCFCWPLAGSSPNALTEQGIPSTARRTTNRPLTP